MAQHMAEECSAFCKTCPQPEEVTNVLARLGFVLAFALPAEEDGAYMQLPPLPAQFHYEGPGGVRAIYLAGPDIALDGELFPAHQARFWLYEGHNQDVCQYIASALAVRWSLTWQPSEPSPSLQGVAQARKTRRCT